VLGALSSPSALAAAELGWTGPKDCQRSSAVAEKVEALVGRPLASIDGLRFTLEVTHGGSDWKLDLGTTQPPDGEPRHRTLNGKSCVEVTDAAAVLIAMSIENAAPPPTPTATPTPAPSATASNVASSESARSRTDAGTAPHRERPPPNRLRASVGAGALFDTAALPGPAFGVAAGAALRTGAARFEAQADVLFPETVALADGAKADISLLSGALLACLAHDTSQLALLGCAGFELGRLSGEGRQVTDPHIASALWAAIRAETGAELSLSPALHLTGRIGLTMPVTRPEFVLDGNLVHRPAAVGLRALLGVELSP
jgi:hypothetical protein